MKNILVLTIILCIAGCAALPKIIDEGEARAIAARHINAELVGKSFVDAKETTHAYPLFTARGWRVAEKVGGRWVVRQDPPAGIYATVSMDEHGGNVKIEEYGVALK